MQIFAKKKLSELIKICQLCTSFVLNTLHYWRVLSGPGGRSSVLTCCGGESPGLTDQADWTDVECLGERLAGRAGRGGGYPKKLDAAEGGTQLPTSLLPPQWAGRPGRGRSGRGGEGGTVPGPAHPA